MLQVLDEINSLQLDQLDEDWVQGIYHSEFLEIPEFPADYESAIDNLNISTVFRNLMRNVDTWLSDESYPEEEKSWASLTNQVNHQKLLTILSFYIDNGTKNVYTKEYRNNALLSSRVYYKLLSIPGFKAYHIYHAQLFTHSLACLSFPRSMCDNENNYFSTKDLTREVNTMIRELRSFVHELRAVIDKLQLQPNDMNFEEILSNLVDITGGAIVNKLNIDKIELANISRVIYEIIDVLLIDPTTSQPSPVAIRLLFKGLLPKLVAASVDWRNSNNIVRASYVTYTGLLLTKYGKAALSGFTVLLQHLCYALDGLEKAEIRTARVSLVVGLMSLLPKKTYRSTINWLIKLSATSKIGHRHIALELLGKLLDNEPEDEPRPEPPPLETPPDEKVTSEEKPPEETDDSQEKPVEADTPNEMETTQNEPETPKLDATTDDESQDSVPAPVVNDPEIAEEEMAGLLRARPHRVPCSLVVRAVLERAQDVSSTLRARALLVLATLPNNPRIPELEEGSPARLMALAARCASDERAAVRRAALILLQRLLITTHTEAGLAVLVNVCRDASVLVRSAGIAALGELARRGDTLTLDAFLSGALHQLSDPENKIQDQVSSLVQQMVFDRLKKYNKDGYEDPLPWAFLAAICRRNLRRHMQKACTMLAKTTNCISIRTVDILSTHLESENTQRQLQSLMLLTCVARHVDYSDVQFIVDYYYSIAEEGKLSDVRLLLFTVQLLTEWSQWIVGDIRAELRSHLVMRLTNGAHSCRIECAILASHLDKTNLVWATELMQLYEKRVVTCPESESAEAALCVADLSLVAPVPPSPNTLKHLMTLIQPLPENTELTLELSTSRGTAVAALGRLCIRDRGTAGTVAPAAAQLAHRAQEPLCARVNALLALADICARCTCIVEPLLGSICSCLDKGAPVELRTAAARALTRLLLGAYLRLRTPLYYRYCALLADPEADVREPAEYYVTWCLGTDVIYQHYVDCILYYNTEKEDGESLSFDSRQLIYDIMLQRMSLVQKLNVQCRLAREIIGHAADLCDDGDELTPALNGALLDTITLLCGPRMKLPRKPQATGDAADLDEIQERVTTNIVSHKMKRTVAEVLVPAVLRLFAHMSGKGGQLATYLVRLATDLLKDYRQEIEEVIENDEELVEKVRQFQETIGEEPSFGNARNLVTTSAPPEPETPRAPKRRRPGASPRSGRPAKRSLRI